MGEVLAMTTRIRRSEEGDRVIRSGPYKGMKVKHLEAAKAELDRLLEQLTRCTCQERKSTTKG